MRQQLENEVLRGADAKQLLDSKIFKEAFDATEKDILEQMKRVKPSDERMHTRLVDAYKILHTIKGHIEFIAETGEVAELQLKEPSKVAGIFRR